MNEWLFLVWFAVIPIIAYMDYLIFRNNFKGTFGVEPTWNYWLFPTFVELVMFFAGMGMMFMYLKATA